MKFIAVLLSGLVLCAGCGGSDPAPKPATPPSAAAEAASVAATPVEAAAPAEVDEGHLDLDTERKPWMGDLDGMVERRVIRVLVPYSKTFYFIDGGTQRGLSYELMQEFDKTLNTQRKLTRLRVAVVFIPVSRDQLLPQLIAGLGDVAAANLTITPERSQKVDFTAPLATDVKELVVTSADAPPVATLDDLSGKEFFVLRASSYYDSLVALNADLARRGKPKIIIREAPPSFETEDVLEMVNAGLVKYTVADRYLGDFWRQIYTQMKVRDDLVVREAGDIAFAIRKNSPQLKTALDAFVAAHKRGTTFGNIMAQRYLRDTRWAKDATSEAERKKFEQLTDLFRKYGEQYQVDWILMAAQGYQESRLDQKVRSKVGAIGVMQVMPATGKELKVGDITKLEPNIHAGVKYVRFMIDQYYADEPMSEIDKALFAFASYNAGPNRIRSLRELTAKRGLDPNKWFNNVEVVVSEKVGRETVQYVSNIYKYYIAYSLVAEQRAKREAQSQLTQS